MKNDNPSNPTTAASDPWEQVAAVEREIRLIAYTSAGDPKLSDNMKMYAIWAGRLQKAIKAAAAAARAGRMIFICSPSRPWKPGLPIPVVHPGAVEVGDRDGGDIVRMRCAVCGHEWTQNKTTRTVRHAWPPHPLPTLKPRADGARWWRSVEYEDGTRGRQVSIDQEEWKEADND